MLRFLFCTFVACLVACAGFAQTFQTVLQDNASAIAKPSRKTVDDVISSLMGAELPQTPEFLERWRDKEVWQRKDDDQFFYVLSSDTPLALIDVDTGDAAGTAEKSDLKQLKPNAGVRGVIGSALVRFQLLDPDLTRRIAAVDAIARNPDADQLEPLRTAIDDEPDATLKIRKRRLERLLTARFDDNKANRIGAINALKDDLSVDVRAVLNQVLTTREAVASEIPEDANVAQILEPDTDFTINEGYEKLVSAELAPSTISDGALKAALEANIIDGSVAGVPLHQLDDQTERVRAYTALATTGDAPPFIPDADRADAVKAHVFYTVYSETDADITDAASATLDAIETRVAASQFADLTLDALSLASIYFLAAVGLAITFGVMGVINMAHGEFIMMGAYTGYVVQLFIPDYTISLIVALPLAFAVTFGAGVAMERLVIRWLYHRPLETLLATFGISIALQQLAKNIFGTQARPLTSPGWLDGAWVFNDVIQISYIRIAIFVLALIFLAVLLFILKRTRLGLEVRAVTQNPGMAASMGINPDKINMLTFGLGSGIAGIAGVAIGLYAKVTSEMGSDYIVQSFMTVVVGGVGNVWGTLAGATLIGFLQKGIEWFNPSNTLAAQTYMILFIILFIQFRPKGIVALKGRAAGD